MTSGAGLVVEKLSAGYVTGMPIVQQASLFASSGEIVSIVGPNGAGKSTLLKAIAGLLTIESGKIQLNGQSIAGVPTDTLAQTGLALVPQLDNIFRTLSVEQNLILAARRYAGDRQHQYRAMQQRFPVLEEKWKDRAGSLSGGQRQFLAVAMALVAEPSLLLLDEPSAGLSPVAAQEVLGMLRGIAQSGVAIVMVEQNVKAALRVSDRAYVLAEGRNQYEGDAAALLNNPVLGEIYLGGQRRQSDATEFV